MITSIENDKLAIYNVSLLTPPVIGLSIIEIQTQNNINLFPNKQFKIKTDNNILLSGVLVFDDTKKYLYLTNPLTTGNEYISSGTYAETFETLKDNQIVTFSDIKTKLIPTPDLYDNDILIKKGNPGLIDGESYLKINNLKYEQTFPGNNNINLLTAVFTKIGNINIPNYLGVGKYETFEHIFGIAGKDFNCKIKIKTTNFDGVYTNDNNQYQIDVLEFSTTERYKNIELILNISRKYTVGSNLNYLTIDAKFDITKIPFVITGDSYLDNKIIHYVKNKTNIFFNSPVSANTIPFQFNTGALNQTILSSNFLINKTILKYNNIGVTLLNSFTNQKFSTKINDGDNLDLYKQPGNYYTLPTTNFSSIQNKATTNNQKFYLDVINMNIDNYNNEFWLLQRYTSYQQIGVTNNYQIVVFERVSINPSNVFSWSPWIEVGKKIHTHDPADIIETTTKRFVSQTDINNWNNLLNINTSTSWKPSVNTIILLGTTYPSAQNGWCCYVIETLSIWIHNGTIWVNQKEIVSNTVNGIVSKEQYIEYFDGSSLDKKVPGKTSFINRLTINPKTIYGNSYEFINNEHIDRVKRTTPLTEQLKQYTIQEGWNVNVFGSNSYVKGTDINGYNFNYIVGNGTGLEFGVNEQIILGKYNLLDNNASFIIGNGTSNILRSNLFSVLLNGITKASGYSVPTKTNDDILVGDGSTITKTSLIEEIYNGIGQYGTEQIVVPAGTENYVLTWTPERITRFSEFGKFSVWLKSSENIYSKEDIPIKLNTEINVSTGKLTAVSYTLTLTSLEAIILIY